METETNDTGCDETAKSSVAVVNDDKKNSMAVHCIYCNSCVMQPNVGLMHEFEFDLPAVTVKAKEAVKFETFKQFWMLEDVLAFENVGVSNSINNIKYLLCADCEMGPIGYFDPTAQHYFVAIDRVKHG